MGKIGMRKLYWAPQATEPTDALPTFSTGRLLGVGIAGDVTYNWASGELYGDDKLIEKIDDIISATLAVQTSYLSLTDMAALYGNTIVSDELGIGSDDLAPYGGLGYIQVLKQTSTGATVYRAFFWPKVKAQMGNDNTASRAGSITIGTFIVNFTAFLPIYGKIAYIKEFATETAASAYLETKLNVATWYEMNVQVQGAGAGESATPLGVSMAAAGSDFEITIAGTATALYDNGTDNVGSISDGVYTVSSVAAAHNIAVIF